MLPPYIDIRLAEKILFIGKSIKVLQQSTQHDQSGSSQAITQQELLEFSNAISAHEKEQKFHVISFELVINRIRSVVSKHLWDLVVVDSNLFGQLAAFKDYFLLSRGDLYQCFIEDTQSIMSLLPLQNAEHDIKFYFKQAAKRSGAESDPFFEKFHVKFENNKNVSAQNQQQSWSNTLELWTENLKLTCNVDWPLHLMFGSSVVEKYDKLFKFLFTIKRVQSQVHRAWLPLVQRKRSLGRETTALLHLRSRMAFLIDNLCFYLHADVIEVQYEVLMERIKSTRDFEVALRSHEDYLQKIAAQCFLNKKQINVLYKLFDMILKLCYIVDSEYSSFEGALKLHVFDEDKSTNLYMKVQELAALFDAQSSLLFQILSGQKVLSPHLAQLLVRLDYNKFYSINMREQGFKGPDITMEGDSSFTNTMIVKHP
ncbi:hypothetical protein AKO1_006098, partial [Acrasis kona]